MNEQGMMHGRNWMPLRGLLMYTNQTEFSPIPALSETAHIYSVNAGVRADFAIQQASVQLSTGLDALRYALCAQQSTAMDPVLWSALFTLEGAAAIVDALAVGIEGATGTDETRAPAT